MTTIESLLEEAIVSTKRNHLDFDITNRFIISIKEYVNNIDNPNAFDEFCRYFSSVDPITKRNTRTNLKNAFWHCNSDIVLFIFDQLYITAISEMEKESSENHKADMLRFYNRYLNIRSIHNDGNPLLYSKNRIYNYIRDINELINYMEPVVKVYVENILKKYDLTINFTDISPNLKNSISNIKDINSFLLKDSFFAKYEYGNLKIDVASTRGYINHPLRTQQDAVLSVSKDNCSLNVVADGAGGSKNGEIASSLIIERLREWFDKIDLSIFNELTNDKIKIIKLSNNLIKQIENKLIEINNEIYTDYNGSYSTVVIAFVTPNFISFVNTGDSTAFAYDKDSDEVHQMSTIHSKTSGMSYEDARHSEENNVITTSIGSIYRPKISSKTSFNDGNVRILLSSDGITDLISENNFVKVLKGEISLSDIVEKAEKFPDIDGEMKSEDNISGILIDIDQTKKRGL